MTSIIDTKFTIVSLGHVVEDYLCYIDYLLYSLKDWEKPQWVFLYDVRDSNFNEEELKKVIEPYNLDYKIEKIHGGSVAAMYYIINFVSTPYVFYLEHDWVFLRNPPSLSVIAEVFDKYNFVKKILFKKDGNGNSLLWAYEDGSGNQIPYSIDHRIKEAPLIQACYWSNNPHMIRVSYLSEVMKGIFPPDIDELYRRGQIHSRAQGVEEPLIDRYRKEVSLNNWNQIKDKWGTFIYGDVSETTYIAHTDASRHYDGECERLAKIWIRDVYNTHRNSM